MDKIQYAKDTEYKCEDCNYYLMIDSGYGYCKRYPPINRIYKKHRWGKPELDITFSIVEFCRKVCGEAEIRNELRSGIPF